MDTKVANSLMDETHIEDCRKRIYTSLERGKAVQVRCVDHSRREHRVMLGSKRALRRRFEQEEKELDQRIENGQGDIEELQEQKSALEMQSLLGVPKEEALWEKELLAAIEPYSQALCTRFATAFYFALPREVRDLVYSHLIALDTRSDDKVTVREEKSSHQSRVYCGRANVQSGDSLWKVDSLEHYLDPRYVGKEIAREIAESWYRMKVFYFDYHDLYLLRKFLEIDRFKYGVIPKSFVRRLELVIDGDYGCLCNTKALYHYGLIQSDDMNSAEAVRWNLEQLFALKTRFANVRLVAYIKDGRRMAGQFVGIVQIITPIVCRLKDRGFCVPVRVYTNQNRVWNIDDSPSSPMDRTLRDMKEKYDEDEVAASSEWLAKLS